MKESPIERKLAAVLSPMLETLGWSIRRQVRFGRYVVDFLLASPSRLVIVEADGEAWHRDRVSQDHARDRWFLRTLGISTIRFLGAEILRNPDVVAVEIIRTIAGQPANVAGVYAQSALAEGVRW